MVIACCRSLSRCQTCMFVAVAVAVRRNSYEECLISRILTSSYSPFRTYLFDAITSTPVYHTFLTSNTTWTENHVDQGSYPKKRLSGPANEGLMTDFIILPKAGEKSPTWAHLLADLQNLHERSDSVEMLKLGAIVWTRGGFDMLPWPMA
jgi:hypothetical protein